MDYNIMDSNEILQENTFNQNIVDDFSDSICYSQEIRNKKSFIDGIRKICPWNEEEDEILKQLVKLHGDKDWKNISQSFVNRSPIQCLHRWTKILKPGLMKGPWTLEEDRKLLKWVEKEGPNKWTQCSGYISGRSGKQCRERWFNSLNPKLKKGSWTAEEDYIIFKRFSEIGSKWSKIAPELPGRTENSIKNRFYSTLRSFATEKKNLNKPSLSNSFEKDVDVSSLSLSNLLSYFPMAFNEKTKNFRTIKEVILESKIAPKNKFLSLKTCRPTELFTPIVNNNTNINNTLNINLTVTKSNCNDKSFYKDNIKDLGISELRSAIENWNAEAFLTIENNLINLENKINNVLSENNIENLNNNLTININKIRIPREETKNSQGDKIINLISHLDELEKLLHKTREELKVVSLSKDLDNTNNYSKINPENHNNNDFRNISALESNSVSNIISPNLFMPDYDIFNFSSKTPLDSFSDIDFYGQRIDDSIPEITEALFN